MAELATLFYAKMTANYALLLGMVTACPLIDLMWLLSGALALLGLAVCGVQSIRAHQLVRAATPYPAHDRLSQRLASLAVRLELTRTPRLYRTERSTMPIFTLGIWYPAIFINPSLASRLDDAELDGALTHELVHVARRDNLKNILTGLSFALVPLLLVQLTAVDLACAPGDLAIIAATTLIGTILAKNLFMGWFRFRRECSCDDRAVSVTGDPVSLASALIRTRAFITSTPSTHRHHPRVLGATSLIRRAEVAHRVRRLIGEHPTKLSDRLARLFRAMALVTGLGICAFLYDFHVARGSLALEESCQIIRGCERAPVCAGEHPE